MRFNGRCTVWHKTDEGYITLHYPCWWQDTEAVNISKSGKTDVDTAAVYLPLLLPARITAANICGTRR